MNKILAKGLLLSVFFSCMIMSCDNPIDDEPNKGQYFFVEIDDSLYPGRTKQFIDEFLADDSYSCKTLCAPWFDNLDYTPNVLAGLKDRHMYFRVISRDGESIAMEYLSPDTIENPYTYSYYAGYGEWVKQEINVSSVIISQYLELEDSQISYWELREKGAGSVYRLEFKNGGTLKYVDTSYLTTIRKGYNSIFSDKKCYNLEGDYLYDISSEGELRINGSEHSLFKYISEEEILYISYAGSYAHFERTNLKTGENTWGFYPETEHKLTNPKTEFSITHKEGSLWEFVCNAIGYEGTKIKISVTIDIDNPGVFSMNEEVL